MRVWRHGVRLCVCLALLILAIRAFPRLEAPTPKSPLSFSHKLVEVVVHTAATEEATATKADSEEADSSCEGRRIFMHELPSSFNTDLLAKCNRGLADWIDFCDHWLNEGFGKRIEESSSSSFPHWYATNNYLLEVIFHRRMVTYPCRTLIPSKADAFFIPYYGGLEALEYLYGEKKHLSDTQGASLINWLKQNATEMWSRYNGADHFMVLGRTSWDFFRQNESSWGTKLLQQPELASVTALVLEKMPWKAAVQEAVPYPTSFHPPSHAALQEWMDKVRNINRTALFSFVGAPRPGKPGDIRMELIEQCNASARCTFTDCTGISCGKNPQVVLSAFMDADFCLQPRGDTPTRRSAFDSMIAGCIPIFFHKDSAYTQYKWHLPGDSESYSVFIDERDIQRGMKVEDTLKKFTQEQIVSLRERVISLLPNIVYLNVSSPGEVSDIPDAFNLSVNGMAEKVNSWKVKQHSCPHCFLERRRMEGAQVHRQRGDATVKGRVNHDSNHSQQQM